MILADTSGLYALIDRGDVNYRQAAKLFRKFAATERFALTQPVLTESWWLIAARLGSYYADLFWKSVVDGTFALIDLDMNDLGSALEIEDKYSDASLGFVDSTSIAACERYKIKKVFTFDRTHFRIYRPEFTDALELLPTL